MHRTIENFYQSLVDYMGCKYEDGYIQDKSENGPKILIDGKKVALPYMDVLKNPDGRAIIHPLNENYTNPETEAFSMIKRKLTLEVNLKLSTLIVSLISVAADVQLQRRAKSSRLLDLISSLGEMDNSVTDGLMSMIRKSKETNNEGFLLSFYLKKNGEYKGVPYSAIGKVNFHMYTELIKALEDKDYKVFGFKARKKDILSLIAIFEAIFPGINQQENYMDGTDNKVFRYLNMLLKISYTVTSRLNELSDLLQELDDDTLKFDYIKSNMDWTQTLEDLYGLTTEIRLIPSQDDIVSEAKHLKLNESKAAEQKPQQGFNPSMVKPTEMATTEHYPPNPVQQVPQPVQPRELSPEDILNGRVYPNQPVMVQQPMMQPGWGQPQPMVQQPPMPSWMVAETMPNPMMNQPVMMQQPMMQQPMGQPGWGQPQFPQQPMGQPGWGQPQPMMQGYQQPMMQPGWGQPQPGWVQEGLSYNPAFASKTSAPW